MRGVGRLRVDRDEPRVEHRQELAGRLLPRQRGPELRAGAEDQRPPALGDVGFDPRPDLGREVGRIGVADDQGVERPQRVGLLLRRIGLGWNHAFIRELHHAAGGRLAEDDGPERDAGVAGQGVAEVAELPAGLAVHEQDVGLVVGHLDRDGPAVVVGPDVAIERSDREGQGDGPDLFHRDLERDDRARLLARPGGGGEHRLPQGGSAGAVERHGDFAAGVAVDLERGLDARDVAPIHALRRLDRRDRRVARGDGRADQDGIDGHPPRREPIDGGDRVAGGVLEPVGQKHDAEHRGRRVPRLQRLGQGGLPVGHPGVGVAGLRGRLERLGQGGKAGRRGLPGEGERLDGVVPGQPADRRLVVLNQPARDLAPRQPRDRPILAFASVSHLAGAELERPGQRLAFLGRAAGVGGGHALGDVHGDDHPPPERLAKRSGRDRLEQGEHQGQRRRQAEPEQENPRPPRDQPPLLAVKHQQQDQRDPPGGDPEPSESRARQQEPPPIQEVERHESGSLRGAAASTIQAGLHPVAELPILHSRAGDTRFDADLVSTRA